MFSEKFHNIYYTKIQNLLKDKLVPNREQIKALSPKEDFALEDIYALIQTVDNPELKDFVIEKANERREKLWGNRLFLVPPLYVTDKCINNCLYCPWRRDNAIQRRSLNTKELKQELHYLISQGYRTIELVGASDIDFTASKIAEYIKITK